ncbi:MAG: DNA/RNA nuclease SfsA [Clostridium sp.]|uniref:DNA/RNA nuclease SfsA n=1 Tax=Clostridium sp. TaxID=1506 RepID=UPI002FC6BE3F
MAVNIDGEKIEGVFINRPNRFIAHVLIDGNIEVCHVANTGRMSEMLRPGVNVIVTKSNNPKRKTKYSLMFVKKKGHLICIKSALANDVFEDFLPRSNWVSGTHKREVTYKNSRFDFHVQSEKEYFIEVKCGTYEEDGVLMFPDAPTDRGCKHLQELIDAKENGYNAGVVIIGFMDYIREFTPNRKIDPKFADKLQEAVEKGVELHVYRSEITEDSIEIIDSIPYKF